MLILIGQSIYIIEDWFSNLPRPLASPLLREYPLITVENDIVFSYTTIAD